VLIAAGITN